MILQKVMTKRPKGEVLVDVLEGATGVALAGFLWTHLILVSSILLGHQSFEQVAKLMEDLYIMPFGAIGIVIIFFMHVVLAGRRIPARYRDQKIVWNHAKTIGHWDTWTWVFQVITGIAILALGSIHMFSVITGGVYLDITLKRASHEFMWFYFILLFLGEYHAGVGLYRLFVKWGNIKRKSMGAVLNIITIAIIVLGLATWVALTGIGGAK